MKELLVSLSPWVTGAAFVAVIILISYVGVVFVRVVSQRKTKISKPDKIIIIFFFVLLVATLSLAQYETHYVLYDIRRLLSQGDLLVTVNGVAMTKKREKQFAEDMRHLYQYKSSAGSAPTSTYDIVLYHGSDKCRLLLKRDSRDKHMYWVYYADFAYKGNIGFVNTSALDVYQPKVSANNKDSHSKQSGVRLGIKGSPSAPS